MGKSDDDKTEGTAGVGGASSGSGAAGSGDAQGSAKAATTAKRMTKTDITVEESTTIKGLIEGDSEIGRVLTRLKANRAFNVVVDF